jgi:hypothetical protein
LVWGQSNAWQEAVYSEVFAPYDSPPYDDVGARRIPQEEVYSEVFGSVDTVLGEILGKNEVMELHNVGARIIPQVNCMREQAVAELFGLDEDESADGEHWTMDGTTGYTLRGPCPPGWTWTIFWGWAEQDYGCLTCQGVGGHFLGCPQRGAA